MDAQGSSVSGVSVKIAQGSNVLFDFQTIGSCVENEMSAAAEFDTSQTYSITITDPLKRYLSAKYVVYAN